MEITRHNITWTLSGTPESGVYANGDPWVVGPVSITMITPMSVLTPNGYTDPITLISSDVIENGSELNPSVTKDDYYQGYRTQFGGSAHVPYVAARNVGRPNEGDISAGNPLIVAIGSIVSTKSSTNPYTRPGLEDAAVLTVVESAPPSGSFRPPYSGTDKIPHWNISDIDWNLIPNLLRSRMASPLALASVAKPSGRLWLDYAGGVYGGREWHPINNMPDYGAHMTKLIGNTALALMLDYSQGDKNSVLIDILQIGIDIYGVLKTFANPMTAGLMGGWYMGGGGHGTGRKLPLAMAGLLLGDSNMPAYVDGVTHKIFQEDQQFFYVDQNRIDTAPLIEADKPRTPYLQADLGLPEWGEQHSNQPNRDWNSWTADYRQIVSPSSYSHALAARILGLQTIWNNDAFFDYADRWHQWVAEVNYPVGTYEYSFSRDFWITFRNDYPPIWSGVPLIHTGVSLSGGGKMINGSGKWI